MPAYEGPRFDMQQPDASQPLSQAAVASRSVDKTPVRPVVHVTIDRIEVRMPPAPARAAPAARYRVVPASPSLGDYLRQRSAKPGGAS